MVRVARVKEGIFNREQTMALKANDEWIVKTAVSEEVYTDREEFLEYFHKAALDAAGRRSMSAVFLGQHRMGKNEIFKRVVNRLFFEQDPKKPGAVVPVYYYCVSVPDFVKRPAQDFPGKILP